MRVKTIAVSIVAMMSVLLLNSSFAETNTHRDVLESIVDNDLAAFKKILDHGYDVNSLEAFDHRDWLMCEVTRRDRIEFLKYAVKSGGDVNKLKLEISQSNSAPLMCAISFRNKEAFNYLISQNANPNIVVCPECKAKHRYLPFREALANDQYQMAFKLLKLTHISEQELEDIRFSLEDNRYLPIPEESEEEYRLKFADYLESKGFELNIWTSEKESSGEWVPPFMREKK